MDFVRFTGELFIYYVLIGLGGGVLIGLTFALFQAIGIDAENQVRAGSSPAASGRHRGRHVAGGGEAERDREHGAGAHPHLRAALRPALSVFMVTMVGTGRDIDPEREILIVFDLLLVVVFALLLYSFSARDPLARRGSSTGFSSRSWGPRWWWTLALWAVGSRISDFGSTPNRVAALGENVVLLVNLAGSAFLYAVSPGRRRLLAAARVADDLPLRPRRLGGGRRLRLSAAVRIRLSATLRSPWCGSSVHLDSRAPTDASYGTPIVLLVRGAPRRIVTDGSSHNCTTSLNAGDGAVAASHLIEPLGFHRRALPSPPPYRQGTGASWQL